MEGTPNHLKLPTRARHWTRLFQDAVLKGHLSTQCIVYTYSPGRYWTVVDHTGEAAGLDSFPTVSTLSEERMLSALPKSGTSQSFSSHHLLGKKTKKQKNTVAYFCSFLLLRVIFQLLTIRHPWAILLELTEQLKQKCKFMPWNLCTQNMTIHSGTQPGLTEKEKRYLICLGVCDKVA